MGIRLYLRCPLKRSIRDIQSCEEERRKVGCDYLSCSAYRGSVVKRWMELTKKEEEGAKETV